jgi:hypothetical protein
VLVALTPSLSRRTPYVQSQRAASRLAIMLRLACPSHPFLGLSGEARAVPATADLGAALSGNVRCAQQPNSGEKNNKDKTRRPEVE